MKCKFDFDTNMEYTFGVDTDIKCTNIKCTFGFDVIQNMELCYLFLPTRHVTHVLNF